MHVTASLKSLSLVVVLAAGTALGHASSITFSLINVNSSAGSLTGTVDIDTATNLVTSANITFNDIAAGSPIFSGLRSQNTFNGIAQAFLSESGGNPGGDLALYYDITSFGSGSGVLNICLHGKDCGDRGSVSSYVKLNGPNGTQGPVYFTSGELNPLIPEPANTVPASEPSSLVLLGTGIAGGAALMARLAARRADAEAVS